MTMPNFLVIGAMKAATTSLWEHLRRHPEVFVSRLKEPSFFALEGQPLDVNGAEGRAVVSRWAARHAVTDLDAYRALFADVAGEPAVGEVSPLYLYSPQAPARIAHHVPEAKLVAVLRNPVERAYSAFLYMRRDGREPLPRFADALAAEDARIRAGWEWLWHYRAVGYYGAHLRRYLERFPRERIRVYLYEDFAADPGRVLHDLFRFLGVADAAVPDVARRHNRSGVPRSAAVIRLMNRPSGLRDVVRAIVPAGVRRRVRARLTDAMLAPAPPMEPAVRQTLAAAYRDDVRVLERLIDRDLAAWGRDDAA